MIPFAWLIERLNDWLIHSSFDLLIDWLIDWLIIYSLTCCITDRNRSIVSGDVFHGSRSLTNNTSKVHFSRTQSNESSGNVISNISMVCQDIPEMQRGHFRPADEYTQNTSTYLSNSNTLWPFYRSPWRSSQCWRYCGSPWRRDRCSCRCFRNLKKIFFIKFASFDVVSYPDFADPELKSVRLSQCAAPTKPQSFPSCSTIQNYPHPGTKETITTWSEKNAWPINQSINQSISRTINLSIPQPTD